MRTVAVTGAASGLGAAVRAVLGADGDRVLGVDLAGSDIDADLSTAEGREVAIRHVAERAGGTLDGAVVCAGLGPQVADGARIVSVNYFGAVDVLDGWRAALERGDAPAAVAISSNSITLDPTVDAALVAACLADDEVEARRLASGLPGNTVYASSKLAIARAVRHRVAAWGEHGIRVNAVAPGPFESALLQGGLDDPQLRPLIEAVPIPLAGGRARAAQIAAAVRFLLGPDASFVHGSILFVDGGTDALLRPDGP